MRAANSHHLQEDATMLTLTRLQRITIRHDPDQLFDDDEHDELVDREATACEYAVSLSLYLADVFDPVGIEVTAVPGEREPRIQVEPEPADEATNRELCAQIRAAIDEHYDLGDFWVEAEVRS